MSDTMTLVCPRCGHRFAHDADGPIPATCPTRRHPWTDGEAFLLRQTAYKTAAALDRMRSAVERIELRDDG